MPEPSSFVLAGLDCASWPAIEPLFRALVDRPVHSEPEFQRWLRDFAELSDTVDEFCCWTRIRNTCHTDDPETEKAFMHVVEKIEPQVKPLYFELQKKFVRAVDVTGLRRDPVVAHLARRWQADVDAYCKQNIPLQVRETKLSTVYDKTYGAMTVEYRGTPHTLQQLAKYLEGTDRVVREEAWRLITDRRMHDFAQLDQVFDELVQVRDEIARNAGNPDYRAHTWLVKKRFDYTPEMCLEFGDSCEKLIIPLIEEWDERAADDLDIPRLRPWDTAVDPRGRPPLRPFAQDDMAGFVEKTGRMVHRLSPYFGKQFATMKLGDTLDLDSRKGKQPGGYQEWLPKSRKPFIFMNAVGSQGDVAILLHEGGHAFHALEASEHVDLTFARGAPSEFSEVASMAMELLAADGYDEFYTADEAARAKRESIEHAIRRLAWVAVIDGFQHWIYTHPTHTSDERTAYWVSLLDRFGSRAVDWNGLEDTRATGWQRQIHLFDYPFYYIEYGIAELGALQLWLRYRKDPDQALANYRQALALGGSRPLPELFQAAGLSFDFSARTIEPLVEAVREKLAALPA